MVAEALTHDDPTRASRCGRLTELKTCPICKHKGWCARTPDGAILCHRVESAIPAKKGDGWWHNLPAKDGDNTERVRWTLADLAPASPQDAALSDEEAAERDAISRAILELCPPSQRHVAYLQSEYGADVPLAGEEIVARYGTLPPPLKRDPIVAALRRRFGDDALLRYPGIRALSR